MLLALALALAGCSRSQPEAPVEENVVVEPTSAPTPSPIAIQTPAPEAVTANASAELPPEPRADVSEQVMDDASTTGMTARANRDEDAPEPEVAGNEEQ